MRRHRLIRIEQDGEVLPSSSAPVGPDDFETIRADVELRRSGEHVIKPAEADDWQLD